MSELSHHHKIPAKQQFQLPLELSENTRAIWTFQTESKDVAFSARFFPTDAVEDSEVIPESRVNSHQLPQQGRFDATTAGTLTLTFNNSFSMFTAKNLTYSVVIEQILGSGGAHTICRTHYGPGSLVEEREDGALVVDLVYGRAILRPDAVISYQTGYYAATSMFQLQLLDRVRSSLKAARASRPLTEEEAAWVTDSCVMRHLQAFSWKVDKALAALLSTLAWRYGEGEAGEADGEDAAAASKPSTVASLRSGIERRLGGLGALVRGLTSPDRKSVV